MEHNNINLNEKIVEKEPVQTGSVSLLFYKIRNITLRELKLSIQDNRLKEGNIDETSTADGFTGKISRKDEAIRVGFARSGVRKISFLTDKGVTPFRLRIIPHHIMVQFEKAGEKDIDLIVQGGSKSFIEGHFLQTLRKIARQRNYELSRLNLSQEFIKRALSLHKGEVYYLKLPPKQLKHLERTSLLPTTPEKELEIADGRVKGANLLTDELLKQLQKPKMNVLEYRARMPSSLREGSLKYAVKAGGEVRFFLGRKDVEKAGSPFDAGIQLFKTLRRQVKKVEGEGKWSTGFLPDKELTISLIRSKLEEETFHKLSDLLLDLETLDLYGQLDESDRKEVFSLFNVLLQQGSTRILRKFDDGFLRLLTKRHVKRHCEMLQKTLQQISMEKFLELCRFGFLLFPCLKSRFMKKSKSLQSPLQRARALRGFTLRQLSFLSEKNVFPSKSEEVKREKRRKQTTLNQKLEKALDMKTAYISRERKKKEVEEFATAFFSALSDVTVSSQGGNLMLNIEREGVPAVTYLIRLVRLGRDLSGEKLEDFAEEIEKRKGVHAGIFFSLTSISKSVEKERREILRSKGILINLIGEESIRRFLQKAIFSFSSLRLIEKKRLSQPSFL